MDSTRGAIIAQYSLGQAFELEGNIDCARDNYKLAELIVERHNQDGIYDYELGRIYYGLSNCRAH